MAALLGAWTASVCADLQSARMLPDRAVWLRGRHIAVHLAAGGSRTDGPMLLYATGDGGWPGQEKLFDRMMPWGYPMAGFSSADYVGSIDGPSRALDSETVAADIDTVVTTALGGLGLPASRPVVLVGFSRGAGLAVAAATSEQFRPRLRGILAVALTPEEDYVTVHVAGTTIGTDRELQTYAVLPRLGSLRVAVIQSTHDEFLPAAEAERRFGPSGPARRFRAIEAKDHSFGGKLTELAEEMKASLEWIVK